MGVVVAEPSANRPVRRAASRLNALGLYCFTNSIAAA